MRTAGIFLLLHLALSACSGTVTTPPLDQDGMTSIDLGTHGIFAGSVSFSGNYSGEERAAPVVRGNYRCQYYNLLYRGTEPSTEASVGDIAVVSPNKSSWSADDPHDFTAPQGLGYIYAAALPAGRYEVYFWNMKCGNNTYYSEPFSLPFEVVAGRLNYFGEARMRHAFRKNFLGLIAPSGADIDFIDRYDRDRPLLEAAYPGLAALPTSRVGLDSPPDQPVSR